MLGQTHASDLWYSVALQHSNPSPLWNSAIPATAPPWNCHLSLWNMAINLKVSKNKKYLSVGKRNVIKSLSNSTWTSRAFHVSFSESAYSYVRHSSIKFDFLFFFPSHKWRTVYQFRVVDRFLRPTGSTNKWEPNSLTTVEEMNFGYQSRSHLKKQDRKPFVIGLSCVKYLYIVPYKNWTEVHQSINSVCGYTMILWVNFSSFILFILVFRDHVNT